MLPVNIGVVLYRSSNRPQGFNSKLADNVANEYIPAKVLWEIPISANIGPLNNEIRNVWPGAVKKICSIPNESRGHRFVNSFII